MFLIRNPTDIKSSEITPKDVYLKRRQFMRGLAAAGVSAALWPELSRAGQKLLNVRKGPFATDEKLTPLADVTGYNNFYEFGTDKRDPAQHAQNLRTFPWSIAIEGEVKKPAVYQMEDLLKHQALEERIYRLRCVEAWSMVVPWAGFPLSDVIKRVQPTSRAKIPLLDIAC